MHRYVPDHANGSDVLMPPPGIHVITLRGFHAGCEVYYSDMQVCCLLFMSMTHCGVGTPDFLLPMETNCGVFPSGPPL